MCLDDKIIKSPFKFLAAYEKDDKAIFFGRDKEVELLYDTTFKADLILVYGQTGTGKTSLIQCGLANRFREIDWFPLYIRRRGNINAALRREINKRAETPIKDGTAIVDAVQSLFLDYFRPVYLIFDQFEELVTLGSEREQQEFFKTVSELLGSKVSCKVILVMREEYIGRLNHFEKVVPGLFDNRMRVETMQISNAEEVIGGSAAAFKIELVPPEETIKQIIENNRDPRGEIQLPYLQVYLDRLYREAAQNSRLQADTPEEIPIGFTLPLVQKIGRMSDVMAAFLYEQAARIQKNLKAAYPAAPDEAVWQVLNEFVTGEGTSAPLEKEKLCTNLSPLPREVLDFCLHRLERARILHEAETDTFEIAHDTLARVVDEQRSMEEKTLLRAEKLVRDRFAAYPDTHLLLTQKDLSFIEPYEDKIKLEEEEIQFLRRSQARASMRRSLTALGVTAVGLIVLLAFLALFQWLRADKNYKRAEANRLATIAQGVVPTNPTHALRIAERAYRLDKDEIVTDIIHRIYRENNFYKILIKSPYSINAVAISPDGKHILGGARDRTARLWDLEGREEQAFAGHEDLLTSAAFSPDGQTILTGSKDRTARLWDLQGNVLQILKGHIGPVNCALFSPDGQYILTGSWDNTARLWDLQGEELLVIEGHEKGILSTAFSADGQYILTGSADHTIRLWNRQGEELKILEGHKDYVNSTAFSADGQRILSGSNDGTARLWDVTGRELQVFEGHGDRVTFAAFSPDGRYILTGSWDKTARLWDTEGNELQVFKGHEEKVTCAVFSPDSQFILTGSHDKTIRLWGHTGIELQILLGHQEAVNSAAFSVDGQYIITGSNDKTARLWNRQGRELKIFKGHEKEVTCTAFSPDSQHVLTGSGDHTAQLWNLEGEEVSRLVGHEGGITAAAFSPDGRYVLTGSRDRTARLWNVKGSTVRIFKGHEDVVTSVAFSADGKRILTGSRDHTAWLWDLQGNPLNPFEKPESLIYSVAISADGRTILTGSIEKTDAIVKLWDIGGEELQVFKGHENRIVSVTFSPDSRYILSGSWDKTARLWDLQGNELHVFKGHGSKVNAAVFSPDGQYILTGSADKTARVWKIKPGLEEFLNSGACEKLTKEQEEKYGLHQD